MPGFTLGGSFMYPTKDWLHFGFEVLYARQGARNVASRLLYASNFEDKDFYNHKVRVFKFK